MKLKDGVFTQVTKIINGKKTNIEPSEKIEFAMQVFDKLSKEISKKEAVITSILDGKHKETSKHYSGNAFDARSWIYTKEEISDLLVNVKENLGTDYDVIFETDHFHIEYDPKKINKS